MRRVLEQLTQTQLNVPRCLWRMLPDQRRLVGGRRHVAAPLRPRVRRRRRSLDHLLARAVPLHVRVRPRQRVLLLVRRVQRRQAEPLPQVRQYLVPFGALKSEEGVLQSYGFPLTFIPI